MSEVRNCAWQFRTLVIALVIGCSLSRVEAQYIWINVSYKAIVDGDTHQPAAYATTNLVNEAIRFGNVMLARYQRGYRLRLAEPLRE